MLTMYISEFVFNNSLSFRTMIAIVFASADNESRWLEVIALCADVWVSVCTTKLFIFQMSPALAFTFLLTWNTWFVTTHRHQSVAYIHHDLFRIEMSFSCLLFSCFRTTTEEKEEVAVENFHEKCVFRAKLSGHTWPGRTIFECCHNHNTTYWLTLGCVCSSIFYWFTKRFLVRLPYAESTSFWSNHSDLSKRKLFLLCVQIILSFVLQTLKET